MAFLLKDAGKNCKKAQAGDSKCDKDGGKVIVSKIMLPLEGSWWDPKSKNWIAPAMDLC